MKFLGYDINPPLLIRSNESLAVNSVTGITFETGPDAIIWTVEFMLIQPRYLAGKMIKTIQAHRKEYKKSRSFTLFDVGGGLIHDGDESKIQSTISLQADAAIDAETIKLKRTTGTSTADKFEPGDFFRIAGSNQIYQVKGTTDVLFNQLNVARNCKIFPPLIKAVTADTRVLPEPNPLAKWHKDSQDPGGVDAGNVTVYQCLFQLINQ